MHTLTRRFAPVLVNHPNFRWLWLARIVSQLGDIANYVALLLFVREISGGSGLALATLAVAQGLPTVLVGPVAGLVADRFRRTHVMIASDLASAALYLILPLCTSVNQVYLIALLARLAYTFFNPARQALMPDLVSKEELVPANAFMQGTWSVMMIIGPVIGAALTAAFGYTLAFLFNAATFLVSALFASRIQVTPRPPRARQPLRAALDQVRLDLLEGWATLRSYRVLTILFVVDVVMAAGLASFDVLEVLFVKDILNATDQQYGGVVTVAGLGGILAAMLLPRLQQRWRDHWLWASATLLFALTFFPYAMTRSYPVFLMIVMAQMMTYMTWSIVHSALLQWLIPDMVRGRVFGLFDTGIGLTRMVIVVLFGILVDSWGIITVFYAVGVLITLGGLFALSQAAFLSQKPTPAPSTLEPAIAEASL